ncbi:hypothetical protein Q5H93_10140 [Hymenobacter sp. ASUV-10]|uniref:Uncharacterized protein n=1 Tax=Hymenobacter aranciens TaxID=3063996 RepID=A0ABT9BA01_9BACT|nr:hypothetical protein [Hymenobacter sp. ASUV-10]MDO7875090.1 hypothetical protein [Hymenobacter sp. ASUV-10]
MTHKTYFQNFFEALAASLSDDEFLAFATTVLANLDTDGGFPEEADFLRAQVAELNKQHQARGVVRGKVASSAALQQAVRLFLKWAQLTNTTRVFPAFPDRNQKERLDILPGGMDYLYQADNDNVVERATYYLTKISNDYGDQTKVTLKEAADQLKLLTDARTSNDTTKAGTKKAAAAIDVQELVVCQGLYRAYSALLARHWAEPMQAYALFPFPNTTGGPEDGNLPELPTTLPTA